MWMVSVLLGVLWHAILCATQCNQLVRATDCVCPGQNVIYECSVMGGSFTVYDGTAFQCRRGDITLRNDQFEGGNSIGVCNSEQFNITGRGLTEVSNCYTSQVNISLGEAVSQSTVSCAVEGLQLEMVGTAEITLSTVAFSAPSVLSLAAASPRYLTFAWSPVSRSCPSLIYRIMATNCGRCPDKTSRTSINCTDFSTSLAQSGRLTCMLSIQTVICDSTSTPIAGNITSKTYTLKVPSAPHVNVTPYYDASKQLVGYNATVTLSDQNQIFEYDSVDGSARSFTLNVFDDNNMECDSAISIAISPESCNTNGVCRHYSETICSTSHTTIAVYVSNVLGNGNSFTETIDNQNGFVTAVFDPKVNPKRVKCIFRNPPQTGTISCTISLESGQTTIRGRVTSEDTVTIFLNGRLESIDTLSYDIIASNGTHQVIVQDVISLENAVPQTSDATGGIVAAVFIFGVILAGLVVVLVLYYWHIIKPKMQLQQLSDDNCQLQKGQDRKIEDINLGYVYLKAEDDQVLSPTVKVIAQHEQAGKFYAITGVDAARKFVSKTRQVLPAEQRKFGYQAYSLFIQNRSSSVELSVDDEFLFCPNNPAKNDVLSKIQPKLPSGVRQAKKWFKRIPVEKETSLGELCKSVFGCDLETSRDKARMYFSYEPPNLDKESTDEDQNSTTMEDRQQLTESTGRLVLAMTKDIQQESTESNGKDEMSNLLKKLVLAMSENHQLYEDTQKVLAKAVIEGSKRKKAGWGKIYFQEAGDRVLKASSEVLLYNPNIEQIYEPYDMYIIPDSEEEIEILSFIQQCHVKKRGADDVCSLEHVYERTDSNQLEDGTKFIALDERGNLCTGLRKVDAMSESYDYKWKLIFVQIKNTDGKATRPRGTLLIYCCH